MRRRIATSLLIILLLTAPAQALVGTEPQDDAGTGRDAPDGPSSDILLLPGRYEGNLTMPRLDDGDAYAVQVPADTWVRITVDGVADCPFLWSESQPSGARCDEEPAGQRAVAEARLAQSGVLAFTFSSPAPASYTFFLEVGEPFADEPLGPAPSGPLPEDLQDDAGSGGDAPDEKARALLLTPGDYEGMLTGLLADATDWYAVAGKGGERIRVTVWNHASCPSLETEAAAPGSEACLTLPPVGYVSQVTLTRDDTVRFSMAALEPEAYRFRIERLPGSFGPPTYTALYPEAPPRPDPRLLPAPEVAPDCPAADGTSGHGDATFPTLTWAALKTGFRAVVAWRTPQPSPAEVVFTLDGGAPQRIVSAALHTEHVFVLDELPIGGVLCFQARADAGETRGEWHALRLANAMNDYDAEAEAYTMNLLVVATEAAPILPYATAAMDTFAQLLWDATDGRIRAGQMVLVSADPEHHEAGFASCDAVVAPVLAPMPHCNAMADVVLNFDELVVAVGYTQIDGIQHPREVIHINNVWTFAVYAQLGGLDAFRSNTAATMLHEMGHYAFGMMDLYGGAGGCVDRRTNISIMGRGYPEFDDAVARCPDEATIPGYIPSWTLLRERFPNVHERPTGPVAGPAGDGGAYRLHVADFAPATHPWPDEPLPMQSDASRLGDAPDRPDPAFRILPGREYGARLDGIWGDSEDWYAFEGKAGTLHVAAQATSESMCPEVYDAEGKQLRIPTCVIADRVSRIQVELSGSGTYYLRFCGPIQPTSYRFAYGIGWEPAPPDQPI